MYGRNQPAFFTGKKETVYYWAIVHFNKLGNMCRACHGSGCLSLVFHRTETGSILDESYAIFGGKSNVRLLSLSATLYSRRNIQICKRNAVNEYAVTALGGGSLFWSF